MDTTGNLVNHAMFYMAGGIAVFDAACGITPIPARIASRFIDNFPARIVALAWFSGSLSTTTAGFDAVFNAAAVPGRAAQMRTDLVLEAADDPRSSTQDATTAGTATATATATTTGGYGATATATDC